MKFLQVLVAGVQLFEILGEIENFCGTINEFFISNFKNLLQFFYLLFQWEVFFELLYNLEGHIDGGCSKYSIVLSLHQLIIVHIHLGEIDTDLDQIFEIFLIQKLVQL